MDASTRGPAARMVADSTKVQKRYIQARQTDSLTKK